MQPDYWQMAMLLMHNGHTHSARDRWELGLYMKLETLHWAMPLCPGVQVERLGVWWLSLWSCLLRPSCGVEGSARTR